MRLLDRVPSPMWMFSSLVLLSASAHASNGMHLIAQHPRQLGLAGAGAAYLGGTDALHLNPAGLVRTPARMWSVGLSAQRANLQQRDPNGQVFRDSLARPLAPQLSIVSADSDWAWGVGLAAQGGMGVEFADMRPPVPMAKPDQLQTKMAYLRLNPALAWRLTPTLSVGAALNLSQLRLSMSQYPETSFAQGTQRFFGVKIEEGQAWGHSASLGIQYQHQAWSWGASYTTKSRLNQFDATATLNFSALKQGKQAYQASLEGFAWPAQLTLATAYQITPDSRLALDYQWLGWSDSHRQLRIAMQAKNAQPSSALPPTLLQTMALNWRDQHVIKAAWEVQVHPELALSLGVNHAPRPMKSPDLRAQFPAIAQNHFTAGLRYHTPERAWNLGIEWVPTTRVQNLNPDRSVNHLGVGTQTQLAQFGLSVGLSQSF